MKIPSVNMEQLLSTICVRIHDIVEERKNLKTKRDSILPLVQKYYPGRFDNMTLDEFIEYHNTHKLEDVYYMNVGSYSTKFSPELVDQWAKELGVEPQSKILIPTNTVADLDELKENLPEDEYNEIIKNMEGKYTEIDKPLSVGYMDLIELYHIPTYSNKVTSSMFGVDVNEFKDDPIMGRGRYRTTGQKIGEIKFGFINLRITGTHTFWKPVVIENYSTTMYKSALVAEDIVCLYSNCREFTGIVSLPIKEC